MKQHNKPPLTSVRIDKWLWAARLYKSRSIAHDAVVGGKVHHHGKRVKPSRGVQTGDTLQVRQGFNEKTIIVKGLIERRVSASEAASLYEETAESHQARAEQQAQHKAGHTAGPTKKPSKKERRKLTQFQENQHD